MMLNNVLPSDNCKKQILQICLVTLFINMSNLIVFSYFGVYLKYELHLSFATLGLLEGFVDGLNYFLKFFSGVLCDSGDKRKKVLHVKKIFNFGIIIIVLCKPFEAIFRSFGLIFLTKVFERIGNALQSTPRDYLLTENAKKNGWGETPFLFKGFCGGLGCFLGSMFSGFLFFIIQDYQKVFYFSIIPGLIAVYLTWDLIQQEKCIKPCIIKGFQDGLLQKRDTKNIFWADTTQKKISKLQKIKEFWKIFKKEKKMINTKFYTLLILSFLYNIGRVSDTMAIIYVFSKSGTSAWCTPFFFSVFHLGTLTASFCLGFCLRKYQNQRFFLEIGLLIFIIALQCFVFCENNIILGYLAMLLLGVYNAFNGIFPNTIVSVVPCSLRGTAHGLYNLVSSCSLLFGGCLGGFFADCFGQKAAFVVSSFITLLVFLTFSYLFCSKIKEKK